jgi:hypothetical protein
VEVLYGNIQKIKNDPHNLSLFGGGMSLHICSPKPVEEKIKIFYCPKCKKKRKVIVKFFEWYPPIAVCKATRRRWKTVFKPCNYVWNFE